MSTGHVSGLVGRLSFAKKSDSDTPVYGPFYWLGHLSRTCLDTCPVSRRRDGRGYARVEVAEKAGSRWPTPKECVLTPSGCPAARLRASRHRCIWVVGTKSTRIRTGTTRAHDYLKGRPDRGRGGSNL